MKIYIVIANFGSQDSVRGCFKSKEDAEESLKEAKIYAEWADIEEHNLIN